MQTQWDADLAPLKIGVVFISACIYRAPTLISWNVSPVLSFLLNSSDNTARFSTSQPACHWYLLLLMMSKCKCVFVWIFSLSECTCLDMSLWQRALMWHDFFLYEMNICTKWNLNIPRFFIKTKASASGNSESHSSSLIMGPLVVSHMRGPSTTLHHNMISSNYFTDSQKHFIMLLASSKASRKHKMFTSNAAHDSCATQQSHCLGLGSLLRR